MFTKVKQNLSFLSSDFGPAVALAAAQEAKAAANAASGQASAVTRAADWALQLSDYRAKTQAAAAADLPAAAGFTDTS